MRTLVNEWHEWRVPLRYAALEGKEKTARVMPKLWMLGNLCVCLKHPSSGALKAATICGRWDEEPTAKEGDKKTEQWTSTTHRHFPWGSWSVTQHISVGVSHKQGCRFSYTQRYRIGPTRANTKLLNYSKPRVQ